MPLDEQVVRLLLRNINIIKKVLKGDHDQIGVSVLDNILREEEPEESSSAMAKMASYLNSSLQMSLPMMNGANSGGHHSITREDSNVSHGNPGYPGYKPSVDPFSPFSASSDNITSDPVSPSYQETSHHTAIPTESIYKYFDDAWQAVRLLMKHFDGKSKGTESSELPPEIAKYVQQIPDLETQSVDYIKSDVTRYLEAHGTVPDPAAIIKMCDGMSLVESFPLGRQSIVAEITENLLKDLREKYAPGTEVAGCQFVEQRFKDFKVQYEEYERVYSFFIPKKWIVPVTLSLIFCKLTGDQLDEHLRKNPEKTQLILNAKEICILNEHRMQEEATKLLSQPQVFCVELESMGNSMD